MMPGLGPINFKQWIEEHRHLLKPPVGNAQVWRDREFIIMVVGGPNRRTDFHINASDEFFYQIEGAITLRVFEEGEVRDIRLNEGDIFLLPGGIPHSPQRPAGTVGLVIERERREGEEDGLRWYCESCGHVLFESFFALTDITTQLTPVIERFYGDEQLRTCEVCGTVAKVPEEVDASASS